MVGVFLSADPVQGNLAGMNPYGYVGGNPETYTDPSGQMYVPDPGGQDWSHQENSEQHWNPFSRIQSYGGNGSQNNSGNSCDAMPCRYGANLQGSTISVVWHSLYADGLGNICSIVCIMVNVPSVAWTYSLLRSDVAIPIQLCTVTVTCAGDEEGSSNGDDWEASETSSSTVDMAADERARPAGTPASDEVTADPEAPAPGSVMSRAAEAASLQNEPEIGGKGKGHPTIGGFVITDSNGNFLYGSDEPLVGTNDFGYNSHAENQAVTLAYDWLAENAEPGENYAVHIITENRPCGPFCEPSIKGGAWLEELQQATGSRGADAGLFVWWHRDWGVLQLFYP